MTADENLPCFIELHLPQADLTNQENAYETDRPLVLAFSLAPLAAQTRTPAAENGWSATSSPKVVRLEQDGITVYVGDFTARNGLLQGTIIIENASPSEGGLWRAVGLFQETIIIENASESPLVFDARSAFLKSVAGRTTAALDPVRVYLDSNRALAGGTRSTYRESAADAAARGALAAESIPPGSSRQGRLVFDEMSVFMRRAADFTLHLSVGSLRFPPVVLRRQVCRN